MSTLPKIWGGMGPGRQNIGGTDDQITEDQINGGARPGDNPISNTFLADVVAGKMPAVSFSKRQGNLNLHAGYFNIESRHQTRRKRRLVASRGAAQGWAMGPGSRIAAIIASPHAKKGIVDHSVYDTTCSGRPDRRLEFSLTHLLTYSPT